MGDLAVRFAGGISGLDGLNVFIAGRVSISVLIPFPCFKRYRCPGFMSVKFSNELFLSGQFTLTSKGPLLFPVPK